MLPAGLQAGPDFGAGLPVEVMAAVFIALIALGIVFMRRI